MICDLVKLEEAKQALHQLMLGQSVRVVVDQDGSRVEYNSTNMGKLQVYVQQMEAACGQAGYPSGGPIGFIF